jgi:hypothetical protein
MRIRENARGLAALLGLLLGAAGAPVAALAGSKVAEEDVWRALGWDFTHAAERAAVLAGVTDCNSNGIDDTVDIAAGTSADCNATGTPDECDIAFGASPDFNRNDVPDECDADCNRNGFPDFIDLAFNLSQDCNLDAIPDDCQLVGNDCNTNQVPDDCESLIPGDLDDDGDLDLGDIVAWPGCLTGADCDRTACAEPVYAPACCPADLDLDGDIDLADFARMQVLLP